MLIRHANALLQVNEQPQPRLYGAEMAAVPQLENAWLLIEKGVIADYGAEPYDGHYTGQEIDATGCMVMPGFVDCHTHLVFAASREEEFVMRIQGAGYEEIAAAGGGILNSAKKLQLANFEELLEGALARAAEIMSQGTVAVEIKSGYGLTLESELMMLRVAKKLKELTPLTIKTTFLGAHAVPKEFGGNRQGYIDLICKEMIPAVAAEELADYCDVFCDRGFFTPEETATILQAGLAHGLLPRIHANELGNTGGVQVAVAHKAISCDHLEYLGEEELALLAGSDTMPVLLPGTAFFLAITPPDAKAMLDSNLPVVLASDYNPGSCPSGNMMLVMSLACTLLKMTPAEAFNAATVNAAAALQLENTHGVIAKGRPAHLVITHPLPSLNAMPYYFGSQRVRATIINGEVVHGV